MAETLVLNVKRQRGRPRSDDARQKILDAATEIVQGDNLTQLTIEGIAARAKVSKQTIYRWWKAPAEVVEEAFVSRRAPASTDVDSGTLDSDLDAALGATIDALAAGNGRFFRALLLGAIDRESYARNFEDYFAAPMFVRVGRAFERGIKRGYPGEPFDTDAALWQLLGALVFRATLHKRFDEPGYKDNLLASWVCLQTPAHIPQHSAHLAQDNQQTAGDRRARGRPRSDVARQSIIDATLAILMESGNAGLTIEGIADKAGVSKQTIYRWWPTAPHIVAEAIQPASAELHPMRDMGTLKDDLLQFFEPVLASLTPASGPTMLAFLRQALLDRSFAPVFHAQVMKPYWDGVSSAVERAVARGELRPCISPQIVTEQIMGAIWARVMGRKPLLDRAFVDGVVTCWTAPWRRPEPAERTLAAK